MSKNSFFCFMPYQCYLKSFFEPYLSTHYWTSQLTFCQTKAFVDTLIKAAMLYWNGTTTIATFLMPHAPKSSTSLPSLKIPLFYLKPIFFWCQKYKIMHFFLILQRLNSIVLPFVYSFKFHLSYPSSLPMII